MDPITHTVDSLQRGIRAYATVYIGQGKSPEEAMMLAAQAMKTEDAYVKMELDLRTARREAISNFYSAFPALVGSVRAGHQEPGSTKRSATRRVGPFIINVSEEGGGETMVVAIAATKEGGTRLTALQEEIVKRLPIVGEALRDTIEEEGKEPILTLTVVLPFPKDGELTITRWMDKLRIAA